MAKIYGDAVVLVRRGGDGSVSRVNAIVLASTIKIPTTLDRKPIKDAAPVEHVDLAFPELSLAPNGQGLKTRNLDEIFRLAYDVAAFEEGKWIGYEDPALSTAKSSGIDGVEGKDWTEVGQDEEGFPVPKGSAQDVTAVKVDSKLVPLAQLADLAIEVAKFEPTFEVKWEDVVPGATTSLQKALQQIEGLSETLSAQNQKVQDLEEIVNQKPEAQPPQPEAPAAE